MTQLQIASHHDDALFVPHYYASVRTMWFNLATKTRHCPCADDAKFYALVRQYDVEDEAYVLTDEDAPSTYYTPRANRLVHDIVNEYPHLIGYEHYFFELMKIHHKASVWEEAQRMDVQYKAKIDAQALAQV